MAFVDRLIPVLVRGDTDGAWGLLRSLDGEQLQEAKGWFAGNRRWLRSLHSLEDYEGDTHDERFGNYEEAVWIIAMCAVALCGPVTAARRVPWADLRDYQERAGEAAFVHLLWDADPAWVAQFTDAASQVSLGRDARRVNGNLSRVLRAALVHHGLPCPSGRTFLAGWLAGTGSGSPVERLSRDPLMPDLLFHRLASGHCGRDPWLPEAVAELVGTGRVDRTALLEHVLNTMTAPQRPGSQRVLAEITTALNLRAEEIPGGLTFLLGVLSTSHGAVGRHLLPHAVELVCDAEGLRELTAVVAGRPERKQQEMLLTALQEPALHSVVGIGHVHAALRQLGASQDAAFATRAARAAAALGAVVVPDEASDATGLWSLSPGPSGVEHRPSWWEYDDTLRTRQPCWQQVLDSAHDPEEFEQPWLVDLALADMSRGEFCDAAAVVEPATRLLSERRLNLARLASALSDLFLGGGMCQGWSAAIAIADACCAAPRKPAGLAGLLRMLASYAHEVPPQDLPPHVIALAAAEGRTKAQMEARKLGALLSGTDSDEFVRRVRTAPLTASDRPVIRGLWHAGGSADLLPSQIRLEDLTLDLTSLRRALEADLAPWRQDGSRDVSFWGPGYSAPTTPGINLVDPDRLLAATVRAIHEYGAEAVRDALTGIERQRGPVDVVAAIDVWVADRLDVATFWRIARRSLTHHEVTQPWRDDRTIAREEYWERVRGLPGLVQALDIDPLVLPAALDSAPARLTFLRACESLLLADETPVVLCAPGYADCTLDFDDLLARLTAAYGVPVGPLDLVQALHRLRHTDAARLEELDQRPMPTSAEFTDPAGAETWDALDLVRTWVSGGGLPPLDPVDDGGMWSTTAKAPVPWSRCAAAPAQLREDPWSPGPIIETVRLMPQWGDRTVSDAYQRYTHFDPRLFPGRIAGPFGLPLHDRLLALLSLTERRNIPRAVCTVLDVARHDRLDPELAAAAAVGRHRAGTLGAGRLTESIGATFESGGLRGLWPSALAIAAALCEVPDKPSGLPDLLRLLATYAHEVPDPRVPDALRWFADGRGSSRSHLEARALVAALERS